MKLMKEHIQQYGVAIGDKILKVDSFLNHQIDPYLMMEVGKEFKARFEGKEITKILTIEASGIAVGITTAFAFQVPMVFAKRINRLRCRSPIMQPSFLLLKTKNTTLLLPRNSYKREIRF